MAPSSAFYDVAGQESLDSLSREELIRIILEQLKLIQELHVEIEQLKRRSSAAPFSKGSSKADPKTPRAQTWPRIISATRGTNRCAGPAVRDWTVTGG